MSILREELITNHLLLDYFDLWDEFDIHKVDDSKTIRYYNLLENHIKNQIDASIRWLESDQARAYFFGETEYQQEVFHALEDEWDSILEGKYPSVEALLSEVYRRGKSKGYADMRSRIRYTEADKLALDFALNYNFGLIQIYDDDVRNQIKNKITEAVVAGEHPYTVVPKILSVAEEKLEESNFTPKQRATMIARTEISRVQNTGILQSYVNEGYTEVKILTAEDDNVCDLCLRYSFEFNKDDDITYENRGKERVHNISKLIKGGLFPPFHPLCRCTYLSVWESKLDEDDFEEYSEDNDVVDLTLKRDSSKKPSNGTADIEWENIKTPQDVAEYFGYDYAFEDDRHYFYDKKGNTSIIIDKYHTIGKGSRHNFIDFDNSGSGLYDLKEILKIYDEAPLILKKSTNEIIFTGSKPGNPKALGGAKAISEEFNGIYTTKRIRIYARSILKDKTLRGNVAQTMYHEMFHCFEYSMIKDKKVIEILSNPSKYSEEDKKWAKKRTHPISDSNEWDKSCKEDSIYQEKNGFIKEEASFYVGDEDSSENWAETGSMVAFTDLEDKSMAVQTNNSLKSVGFDEWIKRHPNKYDFVIRKLRGTKVSDITFKSVIGIFK